MYSLVGLHWNVPALRTQLIQTVSFTWSWILLWPDTSFWSAWRCTRWIHCSSACIREGSPPSCWWVCPRAQRFRLSCNKANTDTWSPVWKWQQPMKTENCQIDLKEWQIVSSFQAKKCHRRWVPHERWSTTQSVICPNFSAGNCSPQITHPLLLMLKLIKASYGTYVLKVCLGSGPTCPLPQTLCFPVGSRSAL